jgi:hypothetical protein
MVVLVTTLNRSTSWRRCCDFRKHPIFYDSVREHQTIRIENKFIARSPKFTLANAAIAPNTEKFHKNLAPASARRANATCFAALQNPTEQGKTVAQRHSGASTKRASSWRKSQFLSCSLTTTRWEIQMSLPIVESPSTSPVDSASHQASIYKDVRMKFIRRIGRTKSLFKRSMFSCCLFRYRQSRIERMVCVPQP